MRSSSSSSSSSSPSCRPKRRRRARSSSSSRSRVRQRAPSSSQSHRRVRRKSAPSSSVSSGGATHRKYNRRRRSSSEGKPRKRSKKGSSSSEACKRKKRVPNGKAVSEAEEKRSRRGDSSRASPAEVGKDKPHKQDKHKTGFENGRTSEDAKSGGDEAKTKGSKTKLPGLGDLTELQKLLDEERRKLKLYVIKAKQEWEERRERKAAAAKGGVTDGDDYYHASEGEVFGPDQRFKVEARIGRGVFSSVYKCIDTTGHGEYAVKFIRSNSTMRKVSEKEVETYRMLATKASKQDPEGARHLIKLAGPETFEHNGHLCLVFNMLKCDLRFGLQKYTQGKGFGLPTLRQYGKQLFLALRALRKLSIIHGDLKPDNILMAMDKLSVQIIDFGSAMVVSEHIRTSYVQPRYYRAPEVILGMPYDTQIDIWSLGTTLFEMATGKVIFVAKTNNGMLRQMLEICGSFPLQFIKKISGEFAGKHFNASSNFLSRDDNDPAGGQARSIPMRHFSTPSRPVLGQLEAALSDPSQGMDRRRHQGMVQHLADLLSQCTTPDPAKRVTPEQALAHAFFKAPDPV